MRALGYGSAIFVAGAGNGETTPHFQTSRVAYLHLPSANFADMYALAQPSQRSGISNLMQSTYSLNCQGPPDMVFILLPCLSVLDARGRQRFFLDGWRIDFDPPCLFSIALSHDHEHPRRYSILRFYGWKPQWKVTLMEGIPHDDGG